MNTHQKISIVSVREAVRRLIEENPELRADAWYPTLFVGDRVLCCDEAAVVEVGGKLAALATLAPEGEMNEGTPTIVGLYTVRAFRRKGYGKAALARAIERGI